VHWITGAMVVPVSRLMSRLFAISRDGSSRRSRPTSAGPQEAATNESDQGAEPLGGRMPAQEALKPIEASGKP
jgi:hypothetical protein